MPLWSLQKQQCDSLLKGLLCLNQQFPENLKISVFLLLTLNCLWSLSFDYEVKAWSKISYTRRIWFGIYDMPERVEWVGTFSIHYGHKIPQFIFFILSSELEANWSFMVFTLLSNSILEIALGSVWQKFNATQSHW